MCLVMSGYPERPDLPTTGRSVAVHASSESPNIGSGVIWCKGTITGASCGSYAIAVLVPVDWRGNWVYVNTS